MLLINRLAILAKLETTYGTDPTPTGGSNAMEVRNFRLTPIVTEREDRQIAYPSLGNNRSVITARYNRMSFEVPMAGAGVVDQPPPYDPLMRACGMARTVVATTRVSYARVSSAFDSTTLYMYLDEVLHKATGVRGSVKGVAPYRGAGKLIFDLIGKFVPVTDVGLPTVNLGTFRAPLAVNSANASGFGLHGVTTMALRELSFDLANQTVFTNLANSAEQVRIVNSQPVASVEMLADTMATKNWFAALEAQDEGVMSLFLGTAAGDIVDIYAPKAQLIDLQYGEFEGMRTLIAQMRLQRNAGNDELLYATR